MGVFGAVFGCRGDGGFNGCCSGARSGVVGFKVAKLSRLVREKVRPAWPDVCVSAKKFALHARNTSKSAFLGVLGEFFRGSASGGLRWASFFAEMLLNGLRWASFFAQSALRPGLVGDVAHEAGCRWGFCSIRNWLPACRRRVTPLMTPFPPIGDGPAAPSAASARAPSRRTSPRRARRRSSTTTSSRRRRNMSAALDRLKQQNEPE